MVSKGAGILTRFDELRILEGEMITPMWVNPSLGGSDKTGQCSRGFALLASAGIRFFALPTFLGKHYKLKLWFSTDPIKYVAGRTS